MKIKLVSVFFALLCAFTIHAEPWLDSRDQFLRADIELLADIGVITIPHTTYPLMWAGIIKDLDNAEISQIDSRYYDAFWRVKKAAKVAINGRAFKELSVSASSAQKTLRSFGDNGRGELNITARSARTTKRFAWNIEVSQVDDSDKNNQTRYDGTYASVIVGNWSLTAGWQEKWWGPGWDSSNILSNNARPPLGVTLQRNYSESFDVPVLDWLGPWSFNLFVAKLDDDKKIEKDAKVSGASFTFKPHQSLEIGVRATTLWGKQSQDASFDSLLDSLLAYETCNEVSNNLTNECDSQGSSNGDRIAGVDFRWTAPINFPLNIYASYYGEDETQPLPSKGITQIGISSVVNIFNETWRWYVESSDTVLDGDQFNQTYESENYADGYRYFAKAMGSTYDNDSQILSFGILGTFNRYNQFSIKVQDIKLNQDGVSFSESAIHTLTDTAEAFKRIRLQWVLNTRHSGSFDIVADYVDNSFNDIESHLSLEWRYNFN